MREPTQDFQSVLHKLVSPEQLKPHPRNACIYGEDENVSSLVDLISRSGWVNPLVVTPTNTIISGHRRWKALLALGWESIPVEVREFSDELAELEALLLENATRFKTTEQKVREAFVWKEVESSNAKNRQLASLKRGNEFPVPENFPERETGESRDRLAHRVGLGSGRTYEKAAKVVTQIDEEVSQGLLEVAQVIRKVLNEQSVDAAHRLLKKTPQERLAIAKLIISGKAKSTRAAAKMVKQNNYAEFNQPAQATYAGFSVGDWVEVNNTTVSFKHYVGQRGQVEQILVLESQISVNLEDSSAKIRFYPHELTLIAKAAPPSPIRVGDLVVIDIDRTCAASPQEKKWNGCFAKVTQIGEMGSVTVNVGNESLRLFPRDLKPMDAASINLREVVERVLRLRRLELDEVECIVLDAIQRREWFTHRQRDYLDFMERFYFPTNLRSVS